MSRAPNVSDFAGTLTSVLQAASPCYLPPMDDTIVRPDLDTEVMWKPMRISRSRTVSIDSADSECMRRQSISEGTASISQQPQRQRRFTISEMFSFGTSRFGSSQQTTIPEATENQGLINPGPRKASFADRK
ncbi:hypothetical protein AB6A40_005616 [Gnathostoma spinigerum]|uniref:Uncharacterized protein n=1 Tax=Gnathostoma spinigerum TaxID=75299 RepID=A0ABD6EQS1_9BILA